MDELNYNLLDELPRDLKMEIQKYLVINQTYLTCKKNWKKYIKIRVSSIIMSDLGLINYNTFNTYIRYLIRNKLDYPFKYVVAEAKINFKPFSFSSNFKLGPSIPGITILISEFKSKGKSFGESPKPIICIF